MSFVDNPNVIPEHGDGVEEVWLHRDGRWWGSDEHGDFPLRAGSPYPVEKGDWNHFKGKEITYHPCSRTLKFTQKRYGEHRYCTGIAYKPDGMCKHHQSRMELDKQQQENFKTGAFTETYEAIYKYLPPHKKVFANSLYRSLVDESTEEFEVEWVDREVDASGWDGVPDTLTLAHPIPNQKEQRCMALWFAALDFVVMQNIREEQFKTAAEEGTAVGEKEFERESDSGQVYTVIDEHHLNLALSRVQKDYKEHLKFGGVVIDNEAEESSKSTRDWVIEIQPDSGDEVVVEEAEPEQELMDLTPPDEN